MYHIYFKKYIVIYTNLDQLTQISEHWCTCIPVYSKVFTIDKISGFFNKYKNQETKRDTRNMFKHASKTSAYSFYEYFIFTPQESYIII